jgi:sugar phosphate isomerase/epimerase
LIVDRREALKRLGAYAAVGALGCSGESAPGDAAALSDTAPGAVAGAAGRQGGLLDAVGLQLYTIRGEMEGGVEAALERVAAIGYRTVEFAGYFGHSASEIRGILERTGLRSPAAHVAPSLEGDAWAAVVEDTLEAGHRYAVLAWIPPDARATLDDWRRWADRMNRAGEVARAAGLQFAYHNHDFEFHEVEGELPFDVIFGRTDPELVRIELDVYWITHGGGDPVAAFRRWPGRVPMIHVKDRTPTGEMADVGAGTIDWPTVLREAERAGVRYPFVEHDHPDGPYRSIEASYRYLAAVSL